jgi:epoxyqueuosine reductase
MALAGGSVAAAPCEADSSHACKHGLMVDAAVQTLTDDVCRVGREAGLVAVGVAAADPFTSTRRDLEDRKRAGLHGGMHFTYGDPVRSTEPGRVVPGARALVVGAHDYRRQAPGPRGPERAVGLVARYSWRDHYAPLRAALGVVATLLVEHGWRAEVLADDNRLVDREAAYRAGLGWYGKNTNLLLPGLGSWFVLGSVVTDAPLSETGTPVSDGCGTCTRCISACPTGALVGPGVLDARRCLAWLLQAPGFFPNEYRVALGGRVYGCDDCQDVCPPNLASERRRPAPPAAPDDEPAVSLVEMLTLDDDSLMARFGRWYIPRRQPRYLRRNALVALGNVGDGADPDVEQVLRAALADGDPIVRGHAVWAAGRLGRADLAAGLLDTEDDPDVRAELAAVAR